jgi:hypothetical protein
MGKFEQQTYSLSFRITLRTFVFVLLCSIFNFSGRAQKKSIAEADQLYKDKQYGLALGSYIKAYEKNKDRSLLLKMGDCSYLGENYISAQQYYQAYFKDSVYEHIPQYANYAKSCKNNGDLKKSVRLYKKIAQINPEDTSARRNIETYGFYLDSVGLVFAFDLDLNYSCIDLDASESLDSTAAPMNYIWKFEDGTEKEGIKFEHCFPKSGEHKIVLNIRDKATGLVKQNDTTLTVSVLSPPVSFTAPENAKQYFYITFDASGTELYGYDILDYVWDMDNGEYAFGKKIKYKYNNLGDYNVKLTLVLRDKYSREKKLYASHKKIVIGNNYAVPSKTFSETMNESK